MLDAAAMLQLIWLSSPALPVGGFSYSEAFEAAVESGRIDKEASAGAWLDDQLHLGLGRSELPVLAKAHAAWNCADGPASIALNDWVLRTRESRETRQQTEQMGRSLVEWMKNRPQSPIHDGAMAQLAAMRPAPSWPIAFALAAAQAGAPRRDTLLAFAFGWAENMVQASMKSVPLGQAAGQRILSALAAAIPALVDAAMLVGDEDRQACMPALAILSAQHETQYSRLFRS
jgi:urease accessory protein